jgi:hypothetical protein
MHHHLSLVVFLAKASKAAWEFHNYRVLCGTICTPELCICVRCLWQLCGRVVGAPLRKLHMWQLLQWPLRVLGMWASTSVELSPQLSSSLVHDTCEAAFSVVYIGAPPGSSARLAMWLRLMLSPTQQAPMWQDCN